MDLYKIYLKKNIGEDILFEPDDVEWGKIRGDINNQGDLFDLINNKLEYSKEQTESLINPLNDEINQLQDDVNALGEQLATTDEKVAENALKIENKADKSDLDGFATEEWVENKGYLTEHQDLSEYAKKSDIPSIVIPETYTKDEIDNKISDAVETLGNSVVDNTNKIGELSAKTDNVFTKQDVIDTFQLKGDYASKNSVDEIKDNVSNLALKVNNVSGKTENNTSDISDLKDRVDYLEEHSEHTQLPLFRTINGYPITGDNSNLQFTADFSNYYDKAEVDKKILDAMLSGEVELDSYLLKDDAEVLYQPKGDYLTNNAADSIFAKKTDIPTPYDDSALINKINSISGNVETLQTKSDDTYSKSEVNELINNIPTGSTYDDTELRNKLNSVSGDVETLKAHSGNTPDLANYYTKSEVDDLIAAAEIGGETELGSYLKKDEAQTLYQPIGNYALKTEIPTLPTNVSAFNNDAGYLTQHQSLNGYATETWVNNKGYLTSVPDTYAKKSDIPTDYVKSTEYQTVDMIGTKADGSTITIKVLVKK